MLPLQNSQTLAFRRHKPQSCHLHGRRIIEIYQFAGRFMENCTKQKLNESIAHLISMKTPKENKHLSLIY